jgi:hypothetical protein
MILSFIHFATLTEQGRAEFVDRLVMSDKVLLGCECCASTALQGADYFLVRTHMPPVVLLA